MSVIQMPSSLKTLSHGFAVYSIANLSCVPGWLPINTVIKTDSLFLVCFKKNAKNPKAHPYSEPNHTGKPLPKIRSILSRAKKKAGGKKKKHFQRSQQL